MNGQERHVLERAVRILSEQATKAAALVDEAMAAGLGGSHPLTVHAKELRLELLKTKAAIERELGTLLLNCSKCGLDVYWIGAWRAAGVLGARGASSARRNPLSSRRCPLDYGAGSPYFSIGNCRSWLDHYLATEGG